MTTLNMAEQRPKRSRVAKRRLRERGVSIGTVVAFDADGRAVVRPGGSKRDAAARSVVELSTADVGREVVLAFEHGRRSRPIVMGRLCAADHASLANVTVDGRSVVVSGEQQITLRCGLSSITLTRAGKVLIHGAYVSTRSTGVNRIKGGSVQIN
jgi:hypothetical protein